MSAPTDPLRQAAADLVSQPGRMLDTISDQLDVAMEALRSSDGSVHFTAGYVAGMSRLVRQARERDRKSVV